MIRTNDYPTTLAQEVTWLPDIPQEELNDRGLYVIRGLTRDLAGQLPARSQEGPILEYCFNDYIKHDGDGNIKRHEDGSIVKGRFYDMGSTEDWQAKGRVDYPLVRKAGEGALRSMGNLWFGPEKPGKDEPEIPGAKITFAMRVYDGANGQGNALPYILVALAAHDREFGNEGVWLEAWGDNPKALRTYEKAGFVEVARTMGKRYGESKERVYMTLGELAA